MITQEFITIGTRQLVQTKSDIYKIQKIGTEEIYGSATDVINSGFEYVETNTLLDEEQMTNAEMLVELGVQPNERGGDKNANHKGYNPYNNFFI